MNSVLHFNAILGFTGLLQSDTKNPLHERHQGYLAHIDGADRHLLTLIDEILDLAKIESGRAQIFMGSVNPCAVVQECTDLIQPIARENKVHYTTSIAWPRGVRPSTPITHDSNKSCSISCRTRSNTIVRVAM